MLQTQQSGHHLGGLDDALQLGQRGTADSGRQVGGRRLQEILAEFVGDARENAADDQDQRQKKSRDVKVQLSLIHI